MNEVNENWIDKTIRFLSPQSGLRRLHARMVHEQLAEEKKSYDGASDGRRTKGWNATGSSQNAESRMSIKRLRQRARDLVRNEPYAARCISALQTNIIGEGIIAKAKAKTAGRANKFQLEWQDWSQSTKCDYDGTNNFYGIQSLGMRTTAEAGEVLIRRVRRDSKFGLDIPLQLQMLEPDYIDDSKDGGVLENGNFTIQGIEYNSKGQRVAYWLYEKHPGDQFGFTALQGINSVRVPAEDIIHHFRVDRPGQVRGITWMAPVMLKMKDLSDYSDFTLLRQKVSSCFTAFVTTPELTDLGPTNKKKSHVIGDRLEPGITEQLPPGYSVEFANPPTSGDFSQFSNAQLRSISAGIGVTYEILTNDYSQVNFSSGRMGWQEFQRNIDQWRAHLVQPRLCDVVWQWFVEAAATAGFGQDKVVAIWTAPRREMIDPTKEVAATKEQLRNGLISLPEAIRLSGYEPEEVLNEIAAVNKVLDKHGLILDSDPRKDADRITKTEDTSGKKPTVNEPETETDDEDDE